MNSKNLKRQIVLGSLAAIVTMVAIAAGCDDLPDDITETQKQALEERAQAPKHATEIVSSRELGTLEVAVGDAGTAGVRCGVCHSIERDGPKATRPEELKEFHTEMEFGHGDITCNSCHSPDDRDMLRLADGRQIAFEETMTLCAQCHGPQMRDYKNGSHGGMAGHWDLTAGPRTRNNCVNCHDPHDPAFPSMIPAPPPRDRLMPTGHHEEKTHE